VSPVLTLAVSPVLPVLPVVPVLALAPVWDVAGPVWAVRLVKPVSAVELVPAVAPVVPVVAVALVSAAVGWVSPVDDVCPVGVTVVVEAVSSVVRVPMGSVDVVVVEPSSGVGGPTGEAAGGTWRQARASTRIRGIATGPLRGR
jgi:hypothetical protein